MNKFCAGVMLYIRKNKLFSHGDHILVACSGGLDSMVLLHVLKTIKDEAGITVSAVHVNHMLRGEESLGDRLFTEACCREWGIPCFSKDIPVGEWLQREGGNRQDMCRRLRYSFFEEVLSKSGAQKVATAHHADDQLETVLMAGLRGTLHKGQFGIPVIRPIAGGKVIRPLLSVMREDIERYAEEMIIPHREDPSNASDTYTRNRIRHHVAPLLKQEFPSGALHVSELARSEQEDRQFLNELANDRLAAILRHEKGKITLSAQAFRHTPAALQKRMVPLLLNYLYPNQKVVLTVQLAEQMQTLMQRSDGTVFLHLPQNRLMVRQYDDVIFEEEAIGAELAGTGIPITEEWTPYVNGFRFKAIPADQAEEAPEAECRYFFSAALLPLQIRTRKDGDRIELAGMARPKKVARLMIDEKMPLTERDGCPLIVSSADNVLLVPGVRASKSISRIRRRTDDWVLMAQDISPPRADL